MPDEHNRTEGGGYVQDEFLISKLFRIVAGARLDKFSSIENAVFSPRVAPGVQAGRGPIDPGVSYNRAFRAPSMVNNNLKTALTTELPLGAIHPALATRNTSSRRRGRESGSHRGTHRRMKWRTGNVRTAPACRPRSTTRTSQEIFFTQTGTWTTARGFPLRPIPPNALWAGFLRAASVPSNYSYKNLGEVKSKGIELGLDGLITSELTGFVNYSFQADPIPEFPRLTPEQALNEINLPARHLFNIGVTYTAPRWFGTVGISHSSDAFWQDVLNDRYHGTTQPFTMVNLTLGAKFQSGRYSAALKVTNLGNQQVQQHVFGASVKRQVMGEFKVHLDK